MGFVLVLGVHEYGGGGVVNSGKEGGSRAKEALEASDTAIHGDADEVRGHCCRLFVALSCTLALPWAESQGGGVWGLVGFVAVKVAHHSTLAEEGGFSHGGAGGVSTAIHKERMKERPSAVPGGHR